MPETVFAVANTSALVVWIALILARFVKPMRRFVDPVAGYLVPALLGAAYAVLIVAFIGKAEGGSFSTLAGVTAFFAQPELLLAGWIHYLAFDLFVGGWIARTADEEGIWPVFTAPILVATFMFGPVGYLAFQLVRLVPRARK